MILPRHQKKLLINPALALTYTNLMKSTLLISIFTSFCLIAANVQAAQRIYFFYLRNTNGNDAISAQCDGNIDSSTVKCHFTQILVRLKTSPEQIDEQWQQIKGEELKDANAVNEFLKDICITQDQYEDAVGKLANAEPQQKHHAIQQMEKLLAVCRNPSQQAVEDYFYSILLQDTETCNIATYEYDVTFQKIEPNKWISNEGPTGVCQTVHITILENEEANPTFWTYKSKKSYLNKKNTFCAGMEDQHEFEIYSWQYLSPLPMGCKYIDFRL